MEKAKNLFFNYSCSRFFMSRDGADYEYDQYGVTAEQEAIWRKEYIDFWTSRLSVDDLEALNNLDHAWAIEAIPDLIKICGQAEGYAKLQYADSIWQLSKSSKLQGDIRKQAIETSIAAWESLLTGNFNIPEQFRKKIISLMPRIEATTAENYVINSAKRQLEEAKKRGNQ
ncbi:MAG TPA: hypothetical protein VFQ23_09810 [Anaerolineales bacterium]|nr:hypothetical protein [Anaerolineales bacterium]